MEIEVFLHLKVALPSEENKLKPRRHRALIVILLFWGSLVFFSCPNCSGPKYRAAVQEWNQLGLCILLVQTATSGGAARRKPSNRDQTGPAGGNLRQRHLPELPHKQTLNEPLQVLQGPLEKFQHSAPVGSAPPTLPS